MSKSTKTGSGHVRHGELHHDMAWDKIGTTITGEDGSSIPPSEELKRKLFWEALDDKEIGSLMSHYMRLFVEEVERRKPHLSGGIGWISFVFLAERTIHMSNITNEDYRRQLIIDMGQRWETARSAGLAMKKDKP